MLLYQVYVGKEPTEKIDFSDIQTNVIFINLIN